MSIPYFKEYRSDNGIISSVDMVTVDGKFYGCSETVISRFEQLTSRVMVDYREWVSLSSFSYRYQFSVNTSDGFSFWFGIGFNTFKGYTSETANLWRIEFNPNKVFKDYIFLKIYSSFLSLSRHLRIRRFDVAFDFPVSRSCCFLIKDNRTYSEVSNSSDDKTQYLGRRSHHGFVKLYNKQLENKLPIPFTRLELTIDFDHQSFDDFEKMFPKVYIIDNFQMRLDDCNLSDTDKFILFTCLENPNSLKMLSRRKGKKIESIIAEYSHTLPLELKAYNHIIWVLHQLVNIEFVQSFMGSEEVIKFQEFYKLSDFEFDLMNDFFDSNGKCDKILDVISARKIYDSLGLRRKRK